MPLQPAPLAQEGRIGAVAEFVLRLGRDRLVTWSDTVDAPTSLIMDAGEMIELLRSRNGASNDRAAHLVGTAVETGTAESSDVTRIDDQADTGPNRQRR
jgi:hypothetical protein